MTTNEIFNAINAKEKEVDRLMGTFVFNEKIRELRKEIHELQTICPHNFQQGHCIICGVTKPT